MSRTGVENLPPVGHIRPAWTSNVAYVKTFVTPISLDLRITVKKTRVLGWIVHHKKN